MKIDISSDNEYRTQLDNRFFPNGTCNTTSMVNMLLTNNVEFQYPTDMQPEDYLTTLLESPEAWARMRQLYPWAVSKGYHPRHVHDMLAWAVNEKLVGRPVVKFSTQSSLAEIAYDIAVRKRACVVSGRFTSYGHIVAVVGLETSQEDIETVDNPGNIDIAAISAFIVDDPYGNYFTGYSSQQGNSIVFPIDAFDWVTREYANPSVKWAHRAA